MGDGLQADIRGLVTAFPKVRPELSLSEMARVRAEALPPSADEDSPDLASPGPRIIVLAFRTAAWLEATPWELARATISTRPVPGYPPIPAGTPSFESAFTTLGSIVAARMMAQMKPQSSLATATTAILWCFFRTRCQ